MHGEIWVFAQDSETGRQIKTALESGRLINRVKICAKKIDLEARFREGPFPLVLIVDLDHLEAWDVIALGRNIDSYGKITQIALIDKETERMLDKAYEAGIKPTCASRCRSRIF